MLDAPGRASIARDVGDAMAFLHTLKPRAVLHRDLKALNVLLFLSGGGHIIAKVCDFGLATATSSSTMANTQTAGRGPVLCMAPECFDGRYTTMTDMCV